eukprot:gene2852-3543_t
MVYHILYSPIVALIGTVAAVDVAQAEKGTKNFGSWLNKNMDDISSIGGGGNETSFDFLENTVVEDIDIDSEAAPICINIVQQNKSVENNIRKSNPINGNQNNSNNYITVFLDKENCTGVKEVITNVKSLLNSYLEDLTTFETSIDQYSQTPQYIPWALIGANLVFQSNSISERLKNEQKNNLKNSNSGINKSWTSTKPSASSIHIGSYQSNGSGLGGGFSTMGKSSINGVSRFFTSRQESLNNLSNSAPSSLNSSKDPDQQHSPDSSKIISSSSPSNNSTIKQSKGNRHKSVIYLKMTYENCESKYDDPTEEDEISSNEPNWETNAIVLLPCRHHVKIPASSSTTIDSIRQLSWASGKMQGHLLEKSLENYTFRWMSNDILFDESTPIKDLVSYSNSRVANIKLELVENDQLCKERLVDLRTSEINGRPAFWKAHVDEVLTFNTKIRDLASLARESPTIENARLTPYPPPKTIPEFFVIKVHFGNQTKSLRCSNNHTAASLMTILSEKVKNTMPFNPNEFRFLITGLHQYISPRVPLLSVEYIVDKIKRTGEIDLTMVELSSLGITKDLGVSNIVYNNNGHTHSNYNQGPSQILEIILKNSQKDREKEKLKDKIKEKEKEKEKSLEENDKENSDVDPENNSQENNNFEPIQNNNLVEDDRVSITSIKENFQVRILHAHEINIQNIAEITTSDPSNIQIFIEVAIYFGGELICSPSSSSLIGYQDTVVWNEWITLQLPVSMIPKGARLCFGLNAKYKDSSFNLGWVSHRLFDSHGIFNTSTPYSLLLWPGKINPIGTCVDNLQSKDQAIIIAFEFRDNYSPGVVYYPDLCSTLPNDHEVPTISNEENDRLESILHQDPLYTLSKEERSLVWKSRYYCQTRPQSLPKLLQSVEWTNPNLVAETFILLRNWPVLPPIDALELLDPKFADCVEIREYAVKCLDQLSDYELELYMLQLVQAIKHDIFHGSVLSLFLLGRVFQNINVLGHPFFWHLRADIDNQEVSERFRVLMATFLRFCPHLVETFKRQIVTLKTLESLSKQVKELPFDKRRVYLEESLRNDPSLNDGMSIPFDPSIKVLEILPEKCKPMDSAKVPLWVVFKNTDQFAPNFQMIVKTGDDLRQDILTLQLLKLMDHMWKSEELDLHLTIYRVIATSMGTGLIEVVQNAETAARIQAAAGGMTGAFKQTPIANWLKNHNITENNYQKAVSKFTLSCAGYCVATYVLGIGDRHNDNIMVDKFGHLFHIDFGHFLGNFKTFAGFQREKAPFVLTPDFVYVIGGKDSPNFNFFVEVCCKAYNILRKNAHMLSTGIPELKSESDIVYLRDKFRLDLTDAEASERFKKLIHESINTLTTQINFAIHIMAHRKAIVQDRKSLILALNVNADDPWAIVYKLPGFFGDSLDISENSCNNFNGNSIEILGDYLCNVYKEKNCKGFSLEFDSNEGNTPPFQSVSYNLRTKEFQANGVIEPSDVNRVFYVDHQPLTNETGKTNAVNNRKCIMLYGPRSSGKTTRIRLREYFSNTYLSFRVSLQINDSVGPFGILEANNKTGSPFNVREGIANPDFCFSMTQNLFQLFATDRNININPEKNSLSNFQSNQYPISHYWSLRGIPLSCDLSILFGDWILVANEKLGSVTD